MSRHSDYLEALNFTSIFKFNKELVGDNPPVPYCIFPLPVDLDQSQVNALENGVIGWENRLFSRLPSEHRVEAFDDIGGVDDFPNG